MRIVAGRHRGRGLVAPEGRDVRPTADRTREAAFNILCQGRLAEGRNPLLEARVLDAFAGTGALGLEALSRGAARTIFMEQQPAALAALRRNIAGLDEAARSEVLSADVLRPPPRGGTREACDLLLMDPPYKRDLAAPALTALAEAGWLAEGALVLVETMNSEDFRPPEAFELRDQRSYGKAKLTFLSYRAEATPSA